MLFYGIKSEKKTRKKTCISNYKIRDVEKIKFLKYTKKIKRLSLNEKHNIHNEYRK